MYETIQTICNFTVVAPVAKRGRKPGRGGRGKGRGGAGRNNARSLSSTPTTKRERSPSVDSTKAQQVRSKVAKLNSVPLLKKSQESPRSLRSRGGQGYSAAADETPTSIQRASSRRKQDNVDELNNQSLSSNNDKTVPLNDVPKNEELIIGETTDSSGKRIPRLIDVSAAHRREALSGVAPLEWNSQDVAQFLRVNDCTAYCDTFTKAVSVYSTYLICII